MAESELDGDLIDRLYAHSMDPGDPTLMGEVAAEIRRLECVIQELKQEAESNA